MECDLKLVLEIVGEFQLVVLFFQVLEKQSVGGIEIEVHLDGPGKTVAHKAKVEEAGPHRYFLRVERMSVITSFQKF